jgi:hypothetical protein
MKPIDETTILRFASGELGVEQESTFLARCELTPEAWRETVLAVAEHHRLLEALGELAAAADAPLPAATPPHRTGAWRMLSLAAAALVAGVVIGIATMHMAGLGSLRETQVVRATQAAPAPGTETTPVAALPATSAAKITTEPLPEDIWPVAQTNDEAQRAVLASHGLEVEEEPTMYVITANNGTRWAIPTQRTKLHFVNR